VTNAAQNCIFMYWDWIFTFLDITLSNCPTGIYAQGASFGSIIVLDSSFTNITTAVLTDYPNDAQVRGILLDRVTATNVGTITNGLPGNPAGSITLSSWAQVRARVLPVHLCCGITWFCLLPGRVWCM
jgi:hypothetical protein